MSREPFDYDLVVIGGGSAGYASARTAAALSLRVAVVEGAETMGGLCILRGCMPSKALIESANRAWTIRRAGEFGLGAGELRVDAGVVVGRKDRLIAEFAEYRRNQLEDGRFDLIRGVGRFTSPHALSVRLLDGGDREITFRAAVLATGSAISRVPVNGLDEAGYLVSDDILGLTRLPESMTVLGGGAIALEMAHYLNGLGVRVTVVQRSPQVLSSDDPDVAAALTEAMEARGVSLHMGTRLVRAGRCGDGKFVEFEQGGTVRRVESEEILQALGRHPALAGLDLEAAGVTVPGKSVPTRDTQQVEGCPHLFAAGDVCGPYEIVHIAIQQGETAARNAARILRGDGGDLERVDYRLRLSVVFTDPEVAVLGITEREAADRGMMIETAKARFDDHGKSLVMGETHGFMKLLADRATGRIAGAAVVGPHAADLIHEVVVAMHYRATPAQLAGIPHYHPTLSELWTEPAEELAGRLGQALA